MKEGEGWIVERDAIDFDSHSASELCCIRVCGLTVRR